ncbi:hypothetical protein GCM10009533_33450 [Saccharopolyspora spinosporotrichia]|uniref:Uncharacterized protein n=1 Tax=Saccharopolyspora erythraea TaxID=1836 RepID=A0ABN1D1B3_SACER
MGEMVRSAERPTAQAQPDPARRSRQHPRPGTDVHLEPVPRLEWSLATEIHPLVDEPARPAALRNSWIHTAPEEQVLELFRRLQGARRRLPAPWWLRALDRGELPSRARAFELEDEVHTLLTGRPGWVFVPWRALGEVGYWEYGPSDRGPMKAPTTVLFTDQHPGWVHVFAAHRDTSPLPVPVDRAPGLLSALPQIESW